MRPGVFDPVAERSSLPLTHGWSFVPDPDARFTPSDLPPGDAIDVPGAWEDHTGGVGGLVTGWYVRRLEIPPEWAGDAAVLRFGAVMASCPVYLDGTPVGGHEGGYLPFEVDLTAHVRAGAAHDLAIRVRNPFGVFDRQPVYSEPGAIDAAAALLGEELTAAPGGKQTWYSSTSGLVRPVTLERRPRVHLGTLAIRPDLAGRRANVRWSVDGPADVAAARAVADRISIEVLDPDGRRVASWTRDGVAAGRRGNGRPRDRRSGGVGAGNPGALPRRGTPRRRRRRHRGPPDGDVRDARRGHARRARDAQRAAGVPARRARPGLLPGHAFDRTISGVPR